MLTVYLAKKCLPWYLLEKQKKCLSLSEVSKTLGTYKIRLHIIQPLLKKQETADLVTFTEEVFNVKLHFLCSVLKGVSFRGKLHLDFKLLLFPYLHFTSFATKNERILEW